MKQIATNIHREFKSSCELISSAESLLDKAKETEIGSYHMILASLIITAFAFEAALNHLGEKFKLWSSDDPMGTLDKYTLLCIEQGLEKPKFNNEPSQFIKRLHTFRNDMAHGKTEYLTQEQKTTSEYDMQYLVAPEWKRLVTLKNSDKALKIVRNTIDELHDRSGVNSHPFISGVEVADITYPSK